MIDIVFIRHGATAGNLQRRYIGRTDEPLCPEGIAQVGKISGLFKVDRLFASPMLRTRQTAEIVFPNMEPELVDDMRETDFGIFEGKTADELSDSEDYQAWLDAMCLSPIPEGESVQDFKERCCKAFEGTVSRLPEDESAAFVVHGGVIMAVLERFAVPKKDFYEYHIKNGEYIHCVYSAGELKVNM